MDVPGPATHALGEAAQAAHAYLAVGVIERDNFFTRGTLYCTLLYFAPDGRLLGLHRKLKPTAAERLIWGEGDGSTLTVVETEFGKVGGLICWENYMPLARMAMYGKGVDIYLAPTADARDTWQATLRHIACEGRCFVLGCNQFVTRAMYPPDLEGVEDLADQPEVLCRGGSAVVSPLGALIAGPLYDGEGILVADLDLGEIRQSVRLRRGRHYACPDVFHLTVNEKPKVRGANRDDRTVGRGSRSASVSASGQGRERKWLQLAIRMYADSRGGAICLFGTHFLGWSGRFFHGFDGLRRLWRESP